MWGKDQGQRTSWAEAGRNSFGPLVEDEEYPQQGPDLDTNPQDTIYK